MLEDVFARARRSPYYAEKFRNYTLDIEHAWKDLPCTTKEDLRAAYPFGLLCIPKESLASYHESSGTSGEPTSTFLSEADWEDIASRFARNAVNLVPSDTVLIKTPYSLVTTAQQMQRAARLKGATVIAADNRCSNMPYSKVIRLLKDLEVTVSWCLPTEALIWAEAAIAQNLDPKRDFPNLRAFVVAGEPLSPAKKKRIEDTWGGVRVYEDYGSTETGSLAGDCENGYLHAWTDRVHFEVVEGLLVVTPLYRVAQPLIRYLVGDEAVLEERNLCGCRLGAKFPRIRILGRIESRISVGSKTLLPVEIEDAVYRLPIERQVRFWRARPRERAFLELHIECPVEQSEDACRELKELIVERCRVPCLVNALPPGSLIKREDLLRKNRFEKPRFVFSEVENWERGLNY